MCLRKCLIEDGTIKSIGSVFTFWRRVMFDREGALDLAHGRKVPVSRGRLLPPHCECTEHGEDDLIVFCHGEQLVAFGFIEGQYYRVKRVFLEPTEIKSFEGMVRPNGI